MRVTDKFVFFFTQYDIFSNHYRCANPFWMPKHQAVGAKFWTVEHFMMYEKAMLFGDTNIAVDIANVYHPQEAKKLGRRVKNFDNSKWEAFRENIVVNGLYAKMMANPTIKDAAIKLRKEGRVFVEASPYDAIWGIKMAENDPGVEDPTNWKGLNLLGNCWHKAIDRVIDTMEVH
ncbi:hypothetical protein [Salmonella phage SSE121]|uniref:NADAR domain-containing protein n=1 Tax=Salmonella phage SSE121 TaxID=1204529 RepID=K4I3Q5_9CAUD|nr:hypothetical protein ACQ19_gp206 [Salmonella phage SSE121]AFU63847.1 hypothetical protein [Salmonella phage SSE121]